MSLDWVGFLDTKYTKFSATFKISTKIFLPYSYNTNTNNQTIKYQNILHIVH